MSEFKEASKENCLNCKYRIGYLCTLIKEDTEDDSKCDKFLDYREKEETK